MPKRLLFLCANGSGRAQVAAYLLHAVAANRYEIWSTPVQVEQEQTLVETVLQEQAIAFFLRVVSFNPPSACSGRRE